MPIVRDLDNPKIVREANCSGETFKPDDCNFGNLIFSKIKAVFNGAVFEGFADFSNAEFDGDVNFTGAIFKNGVNFTKATFNNESVIFNGATFSKKGDVFFSHATFSNNGDVRFKGCKFDNDGVVEFRHAIFSNEGIIDFTGATFTNGGNVSFHNTEFRNIGEMRFSYLIFMNRDHLLFSIKTLQGVRDFKLTECFFLSRGGTYFNNVRIPGNGSVMFQRCYFSCAPKPRFLLGKPPKIDFSGCVFHQAVFEGGEVGWLIDHLKSDKIENPTLQAILKNREVEKPEWVEDITIPTYTRVFDDNVKVHWKDLTVESAKNLTFRMVNLAGSIFDGVTLKHIELNAPSWSRDGGRYTLRAEKELWEKTDGFGKLKPGIDKPSFREELRNVANQCTQLKSNLEGYRDFRTAGDFHFGEQEILKRGFGWLQDGISKTEHALRWLFFISSGYGERPLKAGIGVLIILAVSVLGSMLAQTSGVVCLEGTGADSIWAKIVKTMGHILSPFWKSAEIKNINDTTWWYYFLLFFAKIAIYAQSTMLILAIRRRFKR